MCLHFILKALTGSLPCVVPKDRRFSPEPHSHVSAAAVAAAAAARTAARLRHPREEEVSENKSPVHHRVTAFTSSPYRVTAFTSSL